MSLIVLVLQYVFRDGIVDLERLKNLVDIVGKRMLVLDLSCRKKQSVSVVRKSLPTHLLASLLERRPEILVSRLFHLSSSTPISVSVGRALPAGICSSLASSSSKSQPYNECGNVNGKRGKGNAFLHGRTAAIIKRINK
ncbi:1-(5-phosphoribosyl)-5-[(5-phosphoribosylamino)methylideneamino] imidazole-4-carboxamide isomerase, chloroplastic [Apostasia shenzhenica]|uniref:1-(5-phosphoribosyl)-5-[(5-phosphoribosylamino)methylideneamino] imidazole-4-carboxamide isomerase, chloroplastic n=1 Tax=Apostasia shenzhenica TaxID=1088818 RepID=A0A2H9ZUD1_9ASPA|nr:1-(5-phosphoribosyl)-5-[(5-phosphoribosylamino)methylideneamino] imidazole-4-carboxamide isomerase, chloroplastic [Apostasia shenzhenica]